MAQLLAVVLLAWIALLARAGANADELTPDLADAQTHRAPLARREAFVVASKCSYHMIFL